MDGRQPLTLSAEEMRAMGYRVVDMIVDHLEALPGKALTRRADRARLPAWALQTPAGKGIMPGSTAPQVRSTPWASSR